MSPIGRIFIVLNLILAAVFLAWAANNVATSHDFRKKYNDETAAHATTKTELEGQVSSLRAALDTKTAEADTNRADRDQARGDASRSANQVADLTRQVSESVAANEKLSTAVTDINASLASIDSAKDAAVAAQRTAENERDDALSAAQAATTKSETLTQKNTALEKKILDLNSTIVALQTEVASKETTLATLIDVTGVSLKDIAAQPQIDAMVLQATYDIKPGLIALNVGTTQGVTRGLVFEIYKGTNYKGQARVENVRDDMCTAIILRTENDQIINVGDKASTRL